MSYDLLFTEPRISKGEFQAWFAANPLYQASASQAFYQNKATGVYFTFDYHDPDEHDPEDEEGAIAYSVSFNLNFYRPHFFALEAEMEVTKFVERFGFAIHDPQSNGMENGPYSPEGFLKGWNQGNELGYSAVLSAERRPEQVWSLPTSRLEAIWQWNYEKAQRQQSFSEDIFVPSIIFIITGGVFGSAVVWPDAISELVPEVDFLFIGREKLARKKLFGGATKDQLIIPFEAAKSILAPYRTDGFPLTAYQLPAPQTPRTIQDFVRSLQASPVDAKGVAADQVLNRELVENAGRR